MFIHILTHRVSVRRAEGSSSSGGFSMGSGWRRARNALGFNVCTSPQADPNDPPQDEDTASTESVSEVHSTSGPTTSSQKISSTMTPPTTPRSSSRLNLIRTSIRLSRSTCAICLESMKPGQGAALFTAECSHTFHFSCIASNVRHGNLVCPVCRAKWKEVPWQAPADLPLPTDLAHQFLGRRGLHLPGSSTLSPVRMIPDEAEDQRRPDPVLRILDESIANARGVRRGGPQEPSVYDDDEPLSSPVAAREREHSRNDPMETGDTMSGVREDRSIGEGSVQAEQFQQDGVRNRREEARSRGESRKGSGDIIVTCHPEVSAVAASEERATFTVLVNLKSSASNRKKASGGIPQQRGSVNSSELTTADILDPSCRAPLDLVTVLDVSGSMAGTKLVLLKRAMAFVIRNLSPADRLSVVAFSSSARRLFPLRKMVEEGRRHALRCVDSLVCTGGTNIADGLRKGAKMLDDRRMKNPVASIMLLSDGQDTYTLGNRGHLSGFAGPRHSDSPTDYTRLLPGSMRNGLRPGESQIPVHTFGFGADHDAASMHSIAEVSGGTFSFIQAEVVVQDAFAQCIGGLLSVVVQDATLSITTGAPGLQVKSIDAGSYETSINEGGSQCVVKLGDLYAEEERDILLELKLPAISGVSYGDMGNPMQTFKLLRVSCCFRDPISKTVCKSLTAEVQVIRPESVVAALQTTSVEVDRQRNRVCVARSILEAGHLADNGEISTAQRLLTSAKDALCDSAAFKAGDPLSVSLEAELTEIQLRVANRQIYERTGRAYILSAQSSHFRQRATTRGDFSDNHSREYQTASMADMVNRSHAPDQISAASASTTPSRDRRGRHAGHSGMSPPSNRLLLRRTSGKVQDSHGHYESSH